MTTITQIITDLPAVPDPASDSPSVFSAKAADFVLAQKDMGPELNTWAEQAEALRVEMNALAAAAGYPDAAAFYGVIAEGTHAATAKTTLADADEFPLADSAASFGLKKASWANIKAWLKTYFDPIYAAIAGASTQAFATSSLTASGSVHVISPTSTIGYGVQAGGKVTQATSKSTAVTLNKPCGIITMNSEALAANTEVSFTLFSSSIEVGSIVIISGPSTSSYLYRSGLSSAGSVSIFVKNLTSGALSDAPNINFIIIKGVSA